MQESILRKTAALSKTRAPASLRCFVAKTCPRKLRPMSFLLDSERVLRPRREGLTEEQHSGEPGAAGASVFVATEEAQAAPSGNILRLVAQTTAMVCATIFL